MSTFTNQHDMAGAYVGLVDEWLAKVRVSPANPWASAITSLKDFRAAKLDSGDATVGILQENLREDDDPLYNRYRASVAYDLNAELQSVVNLRSENSYFPAVERMFKMAQAYESNSQRETVPAIEKLALAAYKSYNDRRIKLEVAQLDETQEQARFVDVLYTAVLCMQADPKHAESYVTMIDPEYYRHDERSFCALVAVQDYVSGKEHDLSAVETYLRKSFDPAERSVQESSASFIDRIKRQGRGEGDGGVALR